MRRSSRLLVGVAALLLLAVYVLPLWRIDLHAPQYPEGLGLRIWVDRITGVNPNDLNSINNLNHYIGMHEIEPDDIPELRLMPWVLAGLIGIGLLAAALGRRALLHAWLALLALGAGAGLADFWMWGYRYGHELDEHAAIKVPGMSYQPPVIGSKQLLNFRAAAWPEAGAGIALVVFAIGAAVALRERRRAAAALAGLALAACAAPGPRAIAYGDEVCRHCHMAVVEPRYAAELVTVTGRIHVFDDPGCLAAFVARGDVSPAEIHSLWVADFLRPDSWLDARTAVYLSSRELRTPMSSGLAALRPGTAADSLRAELGGRLLAWDELAGHAHGG